MTSYAPTAIDISRVPAPLAISELDAELLHAQFMARYQQLWDERRLSRPTLGVFDASSILAEPVNIAGEANAWERLLDLGKINDAIKALLATEAKASNLDAIAASKNVQRLVLQPATANEPAAMEDDASLLLRYLLAHDLPSSGSAGRYLYDAFTTWPQLRDARVNGFDVHGRRGDTDVVIIGPDGRAATQAELDLVKAGVRHTNRKPEAAALSVLQAERLEYTVSLVLEVPSIGPAPDVLRTDAQARVRQAADLRTVIGGEIPPGLLAGAAYDANIITVRDLAPVSIAPDPYTVPVMNSLDVTVEVRP